MIHSFTNFFEQDKALDPSKRLSSTATLVINVLDGDDLDPVFVVKDCIMSNDRCVNPEYRASITSETKVKVNIGNCLCNLTCFLYRLQITER